MKNLKEIEDKIKELKEEEESVKEEALSLGVWYANFELIAAQRLFNMCIQSEKEDDGEEQ